MLSAFFETPSPLFHTLHYINTQKTRNPFRTSHRHVTSSNKSYFTMNEHGNTYTLTLKIPELSGRDLNDLKLNVEGNVLTLNIPELTLSSIQDLEPVWEEIPSSARTEQFRIPSHLDVEQITAILSSDKLTITLPKSAPVKHTIQVSSHVAS